ncbi:MAG TPA: MarR family transcriptional regulator [Candidatus Aquilonibacter sp.]
MDTRARRTPAAVRALIESIPAERTFGYLTRLLYIDLRRMLHKGLESHGLTSGVWYYLWALWNEDGITQRELGERVHIKEASTTVTLRLMERDGLIARKRSTEDRRSMHVHLTARGRNLQRELAPISLLGNLTALHGFSKDEVVAMLGFMERAVANLEAFANVAPRARTRAS